ncbi:uncharacterized protein K452DRAFT_296680 [Aplosporella prunicola CBS 121167]|uniref:Uncharacterized protein n=1 Tax=Aplosporella prunicola CBS 121167 TaxID=1176127 RepID=A0A6A6BJX0_9PEZI|nr:uncharacterized protein K452DRAFT_296680 [Aplosporella prunicola CBS 121167]KAF2143683.1 hypothetical protein K452DRAFT_296680 [Aplosporella prunicola CBS 121167]
MPPPKRSRRRIVVDSEDEIEDTIDNGQATKKRRLKGPLRGLAPETNILPSNTAAGSARSLRDRSSRPNYSKKFHPMDVVTRPKMAAKGGFLRRIVQDTSSEEDYMGE